MSEAGALELSSEDGARAVELAREAVESFVEHGQREQPGSMREAFYARSGAFVRITSTRGRGRLRGCAGSNGGENQLGHAIVEAAIEAASENSAGSAIEPKELSNLTISVCLVTDNLLTSEPAADLELGTHGVAVDGGANHGWLYPTIPVENGWSPEEFLSRACRTAGLSPLAWQDGETKVTLFSGRVFREHPDDGRVVGL